MLFGVSRHFGIHNAIVWWGESPNDCLKQSDKKIKSGVKKMKKSVSEKLALKKVTVARLDKNEMDNVNGGGISFLTLSWTCHWHVRQPFTKGDEYLA